MDKSQDSKKEMTVRELRQVLFGIPQKITVAELRLALFDIDDQDRPARSVVIEVAQ